MGPPIHAADSLEVRRCFTTDRLGLVNGFERCRVDESRSRILTNANDPQDPSPPLGG
jgi:hypothetical protein